MFTKEQIEQWFPGERYSWDDPNSEPHRNFDYGPLDSALGDNLVTVMDSDYQGTTRILLRSGNNYAVYVYSWGSCSGCDFAQGCSSVSEYLDYANQAAASLKWDTAANIMARLDADAAKERDDDLCGDRRVIEFTDKCREWFTKNGVIPPAQQQEKHHED